MKTKAACTLMASAVLLFAAGCPEKVTVQGKNDNNKKLTLTKPSNVSLSRGEPSKLTISIARDQFNDPVDVRFDDLPKGVAILDKTTQIPAGQQSATFTLKADDNAAPAKDVQAHVTVTGPDGLRATEAFQVTVKDKN